MVSIVKTIYYTPKNLLKGLVLSVETKKIIVIINKKVGGNFAGVR